MSDDSVAGRLANPDTKWRWITQAPRHVDALTSALSSLTSRLDAIDCDDVNGNIIGVTPERTRRQSYGYDSARVNL